MWDIITNMEPWNKSYFTLQLKLLTYNQSVFKQENIKQHFKNPRVLHYLNFYFIALQKTNKRIYKYCKSSK